MTHLVLTLCLKMVICFLPWSEHPWCSGVCDGKDRGDTILGRTSSTEKLSPSVIQSPLS